MKAPVVLCDVDEVVADLNAEWLRRYNAKYGDSLTPEDITDWDLSNVVKPECGRKIFNFLRMPNLYRHVEPIPGAKEGVETLRRDGYRVVFVTSCVVGSMDQKVRWLLGHGFINGVHSPRDLVITKDKAMVRGDILIDDGLHNVQAYPGPTILMDRPYNRNVNHPMRAKDWNDVVRLVHSAVPL